MWMQPQRVRWTGLKLTVQPHNVVRVQHLFTAKNQVPFPHLPRATAGPGAHQTSPEADGAHRPAESSPSTDTSSLSNSTVSCGWISAGASTRAEEGSRSQQYRPLQWQEWRQSSTSQNSPSHRQRTAEGRGGRRGGGGREDDNIQKAHFGFGKLPILKTPNQMQIWQLKRTVLGSVLVLPGVSQPGWQDTCK